MANDDIINAMVLSLSISSEAEAKLREQAKIAGIDVEAYAARQLERIATWHKTIEEISDPMAQSFAESGMTEDELSEFLEAEKHAMRAERRKRNVFTQ